MVDVVKTAMQCSNLLLRHCEACGCFFGEGLFLARAKLPETLSGGREEKKEEKREILLIAEN